MILLEYQVNKEYIARVLCENKSRPTLHCNGKCQLNKKLAADNEQNNNATSNHNSHSGLSEILFVHPLSDWNTMAYTDGIKTVYPDYLVVDYATPAGSIFHPPATT